MDALDVSVVLLAGRDQDNLHQALLHLEQQTYPAARFDIVLVDQCGSRQVSEMIPRRIEGSPVRIRVLNAPTNSATAGRNYAMSEAIGRWLIFLDVNLLAGPRLIEEHVAAQERHGGNCVIVGNIEPHPQSAKGEVAERAEDLAAGPFVHNQPLRFLDWRFWNLSVPREVALGSGGFDESIVIFGLNDLEFAWRLEQGGLPGFFSEEATAYSWQRLPIGEELERRYAEGYTLWHVLQKTHSEMLANRYLRTTRSLPARASAVLLEPVFRRICGKSTGRILPISWLCHEMTRHAIERGYHDARRGYPPRYRPQT